LQRKSLAWRPTCEKIEFPLAKLRQAHQIFTGYKPRIEHLTTGAQILSMSINGDGFVVKSKA
jgi:hypothetical protein